VGDRRMGCRIRGLPEADPHQLIFRGRVVCRRTGSSCLGGLLS
jgi:hypothetical protein